MIESNVFVSYSSNDKSIVHALAQRLKNDGVRVWLDKWDIKPGESIPLKIQLGLEKSHTVLMCMSPAYFASEWGWTELITQLFHDPINRHRRLIPIMIAECKLPNIIAHLSYVDLRTYSVEEYNRLLDSCLEKQFIQNNEEKAVNYIKHRGEDKKVIEQKEQYKVVITSKPDYEVAHNNYGNFLKSMGRWREAEEHYKLAITYKPDYVDAHNNYGNLLCDMGRQREAEEHYKLAIIYKPDYAEAHYNYGNLLKNMGWQREAEEHYKLAITYKPDYAVAHNNYGNLLYDLGRQREAEEHYKLAIIYKPDYAVAHNNYGNLLKNMGRQREAEEHYKLAEKKF
jgi:tetratricopeptide (TPR) repeat protein